MHLLIPSRLAGAAALAIAAVLVPVAALGATSGPATTTRTAVPACQTSGLVIWLAPVPGSAYAGGFYENLNFTNLSGHACTLRGYPGVTTVGLRGQRIGSPAGWGSRATTTVRLADRATATARLQVSDPANYGGRCFLPGPPPRPGHPGRLPIAAGLRVYPPNQFTSKVVPYPMTACARPGPVWLHASPVGR
jgi:Protein of unknown function (DUF4232)